MKRSAKLVIAFIALAFGIGFACSQRSRVTTSLQGSASPTPAATSTAETPVGGEKKIPAKFILGQDSRAEREGEVPFNHDTHAFEKYSPDGRSVIACVVCHHTDQPKAALMAPLKTSQREEPLTLAVYQKSSQKVSHCRDCHFQDPNDEGKKSPTATYDDGKTKTLDNKLAFHINCNDCHDEAFRLRSELKKKAGFATSDSKDCLVCHKKVE